MKVKPLLITGSHRSGTTIMGEIFSKSKKLYLLYEPFNKDLGIKNINHWYPYQSKDYKKIVDSFLNMNFSLKERGISFIRKTFKSRKNIRYYLYKYFFKYFKKPIIKDPFLLFFSDYLNEKFNYNVIIMVRHPAAFCYSLKRLEWNFDFSNFIKQEKLIEEHLRDEVKLYEKNLSYYEKMALLWRSLYKVMLEKVDGKKGSDGIIIQKHEQFAKNMYESVKTISETFGIEFNSSMKKYIKKINNNKRLKVKKNKLHDFDRNPKKITDYWKKYISKKDLNIIRKYSEPISGKFYDEKSWE